MRVLKPLCAILLILSAGVAWAQDLSTPVAAARTLLSALESGDADLARSAVLDEGDAHEMVDATVEVSRALKELADVTARVFNDEGTKITGPLDRTGAQLEHLKTAKATIDGDRATVPMDGERPLQLRKVNDQWKVDMRATAQEQIPNAIVIMRTLAKTTREMSADIEAKKFATLDEARAAYYGRVARAMESLSQLTTPTTTQPAND